MACHMLSELFYIFNSGVRHKVLLKYFFNLLLLLFIKFRFHFIIINLICIFLLGIQILRFLLILNLLLI